MHQQRQGLENTHRELFDMELLPEAISTDNTCHYLIRLCGSATNCALSTYERSWSNPSDARMTLHVSSLSLPLDANSATTYNSLPENRQKLSIVIMMDLFAFIHHADPTKVRIGEREVGEGEVPLLELTRGRVVPLAGGNAAEDQEIPIDTGVIRIDDIVPATVAEKPKVQKRMRKAEGTSGSIHHPKKLTEDHDTSGDVGASTEVGVTAAAIMPFVTSSVTPTPEHGDGRPTDSVFVGNLWIQCPSKRFVISPDSSHHSSTNAADDEVTSIVSHEPVHHTLFSDPASMGEANQDVAGPSHPVGTELSADSFLCRKTWTQRLFTRNTFLNRMLPMILLLISVVVLLTTWLILLFFSQLRSMDYEQLFIEFNVGTACQTCLSSKRERDAEIAGLKALLSLKEAEVAEAIHLRGQVATFEAAKAAQMYCDDLSIKAASLESEKDKLIDQVSTLEGQFSAVNALHAMDFLLLAQLASHKDASMSDLMDLLRLEGPAAETQKANQLQPSPEQLMLPIHRPEDHVVIGETSLSFSLDVIHAHVQRIRGDDAARRLSLSDAMVPLIEPLSAENLIGEASTFRVPATVTTTALSTNFIQNSSVPLISVADYEVSGAEQPTEVPSPPKIVFEKEELETTQEHTTDS
ncbi:hypothetical protein Tco_0744466 [Tanacetum coccineum]